MEPADQEFERELADGLRRQSDPQPGDINGRVNAMLRRRWREQNVWPLVFVLGFFTTFTVVLVIAFVMLAHFNPNRPIHQPVVKGNPSSTNEPATRVVVDYLQQHPQPPVTKFDNVDRELAALNQVLDGLEVEKKQ